MSYFIANQISFTKDYKFFKVKGGDNNIVPRTNQWTEYINIEYLYEQIDGGMLELRNNTNEKFCFINYLVFERFRFNDKGDYENSYYKKKRDNPESQEIKEFDEKFLNELIQGLKNISYKKIYSIKINDSYIYKNLKKRSFITPNIQFAKKFSKYVALNIAKKYNADVVYNKN